MSHIITPFFPAMIVSLLPNKTSLFLFSVKLLLFHPNVTQNQNRLSSGAWFGWAGKKFQWQWCWYNHENQEGDIEKNLWVQRGKLGGSWIHQHFCPAEREWWFEFSCELCEDIRLGQFWPAVYVRWGRLGQSGRLGLMWSSWCEMTLSRAIRQIRW